MIFFQMLYGRRPFGHDLSQVCMRSAAPAPPGRSLTPGMPAQERILREETILRARTVDFPDKPAVCAEVRFPPSAPPPPLV